VTVPGTALLFESNTTKEDALMVIGSIGSLNVADRLASWGTPVAWFNGLVPLIVGGVTSGVRITVTLARPRLPLGSVAVAVTTLLPSATGIEALQPCLERR
jgi:hypothetical protein